MINQESAKKIQENVRQYIEGQNKIDVAVNEIKNLLNMPEELVTHLVALVSYPIEENDSEMLSNIRLFIEVIRPLLGDI